MIYLESFSLPNALEERSALVANTENRRTIYGSRYPFGVFSYREMPRLEFDHITIFCGGNGSGKTSLLNLIGEKLGLQRESPFNRSSFWGDYLALCRCSENWQFTDKVKNQSRIITSDDVFDELLDLRALNEGIGKKQRELLAQRAEVRTDLQRGYTEAYRLRSLEDLDRLRMAADAAGKTGSQYVSSRLMQDVPGKSNGETAFAHFTRHITEDGLFLLDEPENSLSPALQRQLVDFLRDSVRFYRCQFIISTHSPFLLAMKGAKIYDLDSDPVEPCRWTQLEHIRAYREFFREHEDEFE